MTAELTILAIFLILLLQWRVSGRFNFATATVVRFQAIYWGIAYVARPAYLLIVEPGRPDPLADRRLAWFGYHDGLAPVLGVVLGGQLTFVGTLIIVGVWVNRSVHTQSNLAQLKFSSSRPGLILAITFTVGWIGRILFVVGSGFASVLSFFATVSVCVAVVAIGSQTRRSRLLLLAAVLSEGLWAVAYASKTPIVALLLAFTISATRDLSREQLRRRVPLIAVVAVASFLAIQPIKGIDTAARVDTYSDADAPSVVGQVVSVLQRFDLISAVTDAYYYPAKPWMTATDLATTLSLAAIPKIQVLDYDNVGLRWTEEVRARTIPNQFLGVSLATGPVAEGEALGGIFGVFIESIILALVTIGASTALFSGKISIASASAFFIFDTYLFERGAIGLAEGLSKSLQIFVVVGLLQILFKERSMYRRVPNTSFGNGPEKSSDPHRQTGI